MEKLKECPDRKLGVERRYFTFNDWMSYVWNSVLESKYKEKMSNWNEKLTSYES